MKYTLIAFSGISLAIVLFVIGKYVISIKLYDSKVYKLNHLNKNDLTNVYTNENIGYSFNYPKNANVYKWFGTEENSLRVFSDGNNQGTVCDIYVNGPQSKGQGIQEKMLNYNGLEWEKWRDIYETGDIYARHNVLWYAEKGANRVVMTSVIKVEGYCESIMSTFRFEK